MCRFVIGIVAVSNILLMVLLAALLSEAKYLIFGVLLVREVRLFMLYR
jgi:hypothetical protein